MPVLVPKHLSVDGGGADLVFCSTTQVYYSTGNSPLASVSKAVTNNVAGQGQYHFGILKKPVNPDSDITKSGKQPSGINEGVMFGGIFEEDSSSNSCISLSP